MLDVQYRMKPEISDFPSRQFYDGKLTNGENVRDICYGISDDFDKLSEEMPPWCFFQVDGKERQLHTGSYYNTEEASAVVALLKILRESSTRGSRAKGSEGIRSAWYSPDKIRVITFYSAQVLTLKKMLRAEGLQQVLVATVDSSQGCEADVVILSFVRTSGPGFLADDRRMNVALTRARHRAICLGNPRDSAWAAGSSGTLTNMLRDARQRGCISLLLAETTRGDL